MLSYPCAMQGRQREEQGSNTYVHHHLIIIMIINGLFNQLRQQLGYKLTNYKKECKKKIKGNGDRWV